MDLNPEIFFTRGKIVIILALASCFLWGSAFPAVKYGYELFGLAPGQVPAQLIFAAYRFTLAGALVLAFAAAIRLRIFIGGIRVWAHLFTMGLSMTTLQYIFFYVGLSHTSAVKASILTASPFFSVILAHFLCAGDRLNRRTVLGCLLGFMGIFVVNRGGASVDWDFHPTGEGFIIMSSFCMSAAAIYGKSISRTVNPIVMTGWQLFVGGAALMLIGFSAGGRVTGFTAGNTALLLYMAFISSAAFVLYAILMKYNPVSRISIFNFSIPLFGACLSALFLGERLLEWKNLAALILVSGGIWLVNSRKG